MSLLLNKVAEIFFSEDSVSVRPLVAASSIYRQSEPRREKSCNWFLSQRKAQQHVRVRQHKSPTFARAHTHINQLIPPFQGKAIKIENKTRKMSQ